MEDDQDIRDLLVKTMCAGAVGIAGAEVVRAGFHQFVNQRSLFGSTFVQLHDFIHSAISAFILIICSYEKAVLMRSGMRIAYFILTFILGIVFSRIFASSSPSPFFPLRKHWRLIRNGNENKRGKTKTSTANKCFQVVSTYFHFAWPSILGQCLGLFVAIRWMKIYWDGWVTSQHVTHLPMLDECIESLNTGTLMAFIIETMVTFALLHSFSFIDKWSRDGESTWRGYPLVRNGAKSLVVILAMYLFLDVTGCYCNPFHALALQRHCFNKGVFMTSCILFVYVLGPFLGTVAYLIWWGSEGAQEKSKRSV